LRRSELSSDHDPQQDIESPDRGIGQVDRRCAVGNGHPGAIATADVSEMTALKGTASKIELKESELDR